MSFVKELQWRGMIHDIMPGTEELMDKEMVTAYVGIDPTADSLHNWSLGWRNDVETPSGCRPPSACFSWWCYWYDW